MYTLFTKWRRDIIYQMALLCLECVECTGWSSESGVFCACEASLNLVHFTCETLAIDILTPGTGLETARLSQYSYCHILCLLSWKNLAPLPVFRNHTTSCLFRLNSS